MARERPAPTSETLIHEFNYTGADVPRDEAPRVHINFWLIWGDPPLDGQDREIVIEEFRFVPASACPGDLDGDDDTDVFDFGVLAASFGSAVPALTSGDYDGDSDVDVFDFGVLASDFGCGPVP